MESLVRFINGEANPKIISGQHRNEFYDNHCDDNLDETKPKVRKRVLINNDGHVVKDSFYANHEMFSDLGPRENADKVYCGKLLTEDL